MSKYDASMDRDANSQVITSNEAFKLESTVTFAAATTGALGQHTLFTVTGNVIVQVFGIVDLLLESATSGASMSLGTSSNLTGIIPLTGASYLASNHIWTGLDNTAPMEVAQLGTLTYATAFVVANGADIISDITGEAVSSGVMKFYCLWRPLSNDGNITVTTPA